ncbi:MAG: hypothetical protein U0931_01310 [Vulcanimicrobiota bacterium]
MISSIFQRSPASSTRPGQRLFKKPSEEPVDAFKSVEPINAFKPALLTQPVAGGTATQAAPAASAAATTAAALPGPLAALYSSVLCVVSDSAEGPRQLQTLADQGKLSQVTLHNLNDLTQKPRAAGLDGAALTRETLAVLSGPDQNIWQGNRYTCGAANLERQLADNPESFTSLVANLSSLEGRTYLVGGFELKRAEGCARQDDSGRNNTDRLIQSSLMAAAGAGRGNYDVATDRFGEDRDGGLKISEISAMTALTQNQSQIVIAYDSKSARATQELLAQLKPGETFQTAMTNWEGKEHMLLFQGCQNGEVTYFDPSDHAQHTIGLRDYLWKTQYLVLPQSLAERVQFPPESVHSRVDL